MKRFFVFTCFLLHGLMAFSQAAALGYTGRMNLLTSEDRFQYINPFDAREKEIVGERYFYDSLYRAGELKTTKKLYTEELTYRFDQIERTVQVKLDNGKQLFLYEKDIEYCKLFIEGKTVVFMPEMVPNGRRQPTLLQVVYKTPTLQLYRDTRKYIFRVKSEYTDGYSSDKIYDEIRKDYHYYFRKGDKGPFKEVKIDAKSFIDVLPQKRAQILQLFRAGQTKGGLSVTKLSDIMTELDKTNN